MAWYAASLICYVQFKDGNQHVYPVWENVVLVHGNDDADAQRKSMSIGQRYQGDSQGTFTWEGRPAKWVFVGLRKLMQCDGHEDRPNDGTEITFSQFELANESDLQKLAAGETVRLVYED